MTKNTKAPVTETKASPTAQAKASSSDDGWIDESQPEIDGWYKPREGETFEGQMLYHFQVADRRGQMRDVVCVRLAKPHIGVLKDAEEVELAAGDIMGVSIRARLAVMLEYVASRAHCRITALGEKDIGDGRSMWDFKVLFRGGRKGPPPTRARALSVGDGGDDGVIPF